MFEVSFPELVILAVVALLVLGPERLPRAAQFVGLWVRKARAQWFAVKSEFERELAAEELKRSLQQARDAAGEVETVMRQTTRDLDTAARDVGTAMQDAAREVESATHGAAPTRLPSSPETAADAAANAVPDTVPDAGRTHGVTQAAMAASADAGDDAERAHDHTAR